MSNVPIGICYGMSNIPIGICYGMNNVPIGICYGMSNVPIGICYGMLLIFSGESKSPLVPMVPPMHTYVYPALN